MCIIKAKVSPKEFYSYVDKIIASVADQLNDCIVMFLRLVQRYFCLIGHKLNPQKDDDVTRRYWLSFGTDFVFCKGRDESEKFVLPFKTQHYSTTTIIALLKCNKKMAEFQCSL